MKRETNLFLDRWESPMGTLLLVTDREGALRALEFADLESRMQRLLARYYPNYQLQAGPAPPALLQALQAYFQGELSALESVPVAMGGTEFQRQVWTGLRQIPAGTTFSYGQLAHQLGRAQASRAVGAANGANPIGIVVPCHRVIGANGSLTGYGGGMARKQWLLQHEAR